MQDLLRTLVPKFLRRARRDWLLRRRWKSYEKLSTKETFQRIYEDGVWGTSNDPNEKYFSGSGSHSQSIVSAYVAALETFLLTFPRKPDVVDLGCGDFAVGSRIRHLCRNYVACDVVGPLIERNRQRFASLGVDFREVDITKDPLPPADVAFLRQVLQHLSNGQIESIIAKIPVTYRFLVLTEHLPPGENFTPNVDKTPGPHTRIDAGGRPSGVVLTAPPFNFRSLSTTMLCEVRDYLGVIRTTLFEFDQTRRS